MASASCSRTTSVAAELPAGHIGIRNRSATHIWLEKKCQPRAVCMATVGSTVGRQTVSNLRSWRRSSPGRNWLISAEGYRVP
eukprot:scaffold127616_cov42-Prasinocladus_malaysianus.AAC.2